MPEEFEFTSSNKLHSGPLARLMPIGDNIQDLKLVCYNEKVRRKYPEWGILELCKEEVQKTFSTYLKNLSQKRARLAISRGDLENAPIIELGMLRCLRLHGPCASSRPSDIELASILASVEGPLVVIKSTTMPAKTSIIENHTSVKVPPSTVTLVVTITSFIQVHPTLSDAEVDEFSDIKPTPHYPSTSSIILSSEKDHGKKKPNFNFDSLDKPPVYSENPVAFEAYRSWLTAETTPLPKTWPGIMWVKVPAKTKTSRVTTTSILTTTVTAVSVSSTQMSYDEVVEDKLDKNSPCKTPNFVSKRSHNS